MGLEVFWRESAPVEGHTFAGGCYGGKGGFAVMRAPSPLYFFFEVTNCVKNMLISRGIHFIKSVRTLVDFSGGLSHTSENLVV